MTFLQTMRYFGFLIFGFECLDLNKKKGYGHMDIYDMFM